MKVDDTIRVELDDNDIREALELFVRSKLTMQGTDKASLGLTKLRIYADHLMALCADKATGLVPERPAVDYGLEACVEFEPVAKPKLRGLNETVGIRS